MKRVRMCHFFQIQDATLLTVVYRTLEMIMRDVALWWRHNQDQTLLWNISYITRFSSKIWMQQVSLMSWPMIMIHNSIEIYNNSTTGVFPDETQKQFIFLSCQRMSVLLIVNSLLLNKDPCTKRELWKAGRLFERHHHQYRRGIRNYTHALRLVSVLYPSWENLFHSYLVQLYISVCSDEPYSMSFDQMHVQKLVFPKQNDKSTIYEFWTYLIQFMFLRILTPWSYHHAWNAHYSN